MDAQLKQRVNEFRLLRRLRPARSLPPRVTCVVVFSGPMRSDRVDWPFAGYSEEAMDRVLAAVELVRDYEQQGRLVPLHLYATIEQMPVYSRIAALAGLPPGRVREVIGGERYSQAGLPLANTKTQAQDLERELGQTPDAFPLVLTSSYHVPRTVRTVLRWFSRDFMIASVSLRRPAGYLRLIKSEMRRIDLYSSAGDCSSDWSRARAEYLGRLPYPEVPPELGHLYGS